MGRFVLWLAGFTAVIWACGAFILWRADPGLWSVDDRGLAVVFWVIAAGVSAALAWGPRG